MKISEIISILESEFPTEKAYSWDNVGLLIGDASRDIKKIMVTLDVSEATAYEAVQNGVDLIVSHHPILFNGAKRLTADTNYGRMIMSLIEHHIAVYAAHTNCDVAENGINAHLAKMFSLQRVENLEENGLGRIGNIPFEMPFSQFAVLTKRLLKTPTLRVSGNTDKIVRRVAVGSGSCSECVPIAIEKGADVMITADMKYHETINLTESGITIIDAGHFPTEICVMDIFISLLKCCPVEIIRSVNTDIFKFI